MAWCKVSSLSAAVARTLKGERFPMTRSSILARTEGKSVEGWDVSHFLGEALTKRTYPDIRSILADLDDWLEVQG